MEKSMELGYIFDRIGILLLLFVICMYFGIRLLITEDPGPIWNKNKGPLKNGKEYAKAGGRLILFFGAATLVMAALVFVNLYAAVMEIATCTVIVGVLWKKMNDKYGA